MAVVDSSALIPLAWVGRLDLVSTTFDEGRTTEAVREDVLVEGTRGTAVLDDFLEDVAVHETPETAHELASMDGIAVADASVILLAEDHGGVLVANDTELIEVARSHGVERWWVTTLLLKCTKTVDLTADEATGVLYDLVDEGCSRIASARGCSRRKIEVVSCRCVRQECLGVTVGRRSPREAPWGRTRSRTRPQSLP